jgi:aspartokinase
MVTVSNVVQKLVDDRVFIQESMYRDIISYALLAKQLKPEVQNLLDRQVKKHAIEMALRRYSEKIRQNHNNISFDYSSDIIMKTQICDISVQKTSSLVTLIKKMYDIVDFTKGDILNIIQGNFEVSIITNKRNKKRFLDLLKNEKIHNIEEDLISLSMTFSKDFLYTPGVVFNIIRNIAWNNINIFEIVSTNTELTFILNKNDAMKGYNALEKLIQP